MSYRDRTIIEASDKTYWPAKPGKVTKLNPVIVRAMHMSRPAQKQARALIERTAELTYAAATMPITDKQIAARAGRAGQ
jgi:hypothetical protein